MSETEESATETTAGRPWVTRTVIGIVLATFFSDFSHEMCTAVLPLYLAGVGLGPAALGIIEAVADFLGSASRLGGGVVGHHVFHKRAWTSLGYLVTSLAIGAIGLVRGLAALVTLRSVAWIGRGFRGPLRDYLLADAVEKSHYGRAFGLERAGDMLGAMAGPLTAALLVWAGIEFPAIILWTLVPGILAAAAMFFMTREQVTAAPTSAEAGHAVDRPELAISKAFWLFLVGVFLFGLGDFSRTFLILLASNATSGGGLPGGISIAVMLYTIHNVVSAAVAYPVGHLGDRRAKLPILILGFILGVATNLLLALHSGSIGWLAFAVVLSGVYIAIQETLQKAVAAELLPRARRSLGFGYLAGGNAIGDMVSSLYVGCLLQAGRPGLAFGIAAAAGALGVVWMIGFALRKSM